MSLPSLGTLPIILPLDLLLFPNRMATHSFHHPTKKENKKKTKHTLKNKLKRQTHLSLLSPSTLPPRPQTQPPQLPFLLNFSNTNKKKERGFNINHMHLPI